MNLPMINNRNMKSTGKNSHTLAQSTPSLEEFGLGIQVFKIQASKGLDSNHPQTRKFMKNIQNPVSIPQPPPVKRTQVLPSLSCQKREKTVFLESGFLQRRTAIQKKKPSGIVDTIKQVEEKQPLAKKISSAQQIIKNPALEQPNLPQEPEIIQPHYRESLNELTHFYTDLKNRQAENLKQIKRLRKMKQNADEDLLQKEMRLRANKSEMVQDMVERQNLQSFPPEQLYDEFSLQIYMASGQRFRFEDEDMFQMNNDDDDF